VTPSQRTELPQTANFPDFIRKTSA